MQKLLTVSQAIWPQRTVFDVAPARWLARNIALMLGFSILIALSAHLQIKLAGTPVPITGQTFGVLLTGALLGPRLGIATLVLYLVEGWIGLPVFASVGNIASLGYLIGFVPAAGAVGMLAERGWDRKPLTSALMMLVGNEIIYFFGVIWLQSYVGGLANALKFGVLPFLVGDAIKLVAATALLPLGWKYLDRANRNES